MWVQGGTPLDGRKAIRGKPKQTVGSVKKNKPIKEANVSGIG